MNTYPIYTSPLPEGLRPGLYLGLHHGFATDEERQAATDNGEWGADGALIGPLVHIHGVYNTNLELEFVDLDSARPYRAAFGESLSVNAALWYGERVNKPEGTNKIIINYGTGNPDYEDCLFFDGIYYGDWTVITV